MTAISRLLLERDFQTPTQYPVPTTCCHNLFSLHSTHFSCNLVDTLSYLFATRHRQKELALCVLVCVFSTYWIGIDTRSHIMSGLRSNTRNANELILALQTLNAVHQSNKRKRDEKEKTKWKGIEELEPMLGRILKRMRKTNDSSADTLKQIEQATISDGDMLDLATLQLNLQTVSILPFVPINLVIYNNSLHIGTCITKEAYGQKAIYHVWGSSGCICEIQYQQYQ